MIKVKTGYVGYNHIWKSDGEYKYLEIDKWKNINRDIFNGPVFDEVIEGKLLVNCSYFYQYKLMLDSKDIEIFKITDKKFIKSIKKARKIVRKHYPRTSDKINYSYYINHNSIILQENCDTWIADNSIFFKNVITTLIFDVNDRRFKLTLLDEYAKEIQIGDEVITYYDSIKESKDKIKKINIELDRKINKYIKELEFDKICKRVDHWLIIDLPNGNSEIFELEFNEKYIGINIFTYGENPTRTVRTLLWHHNTEHLQQGPDKCLYRLSYSIKDIKFEDIITYYRAIPIFGIVKDIE